MWKSCSDITPNYNKRSWERRGGQNLIYWNPPLFCCWAASSPVSARCCGPREIHHSRRRRSRSAGSKQNQVEADHRVTGQSKKSVTWSSCQTSRAWATSSLVWLRASPHLQTRPQIRSSNLTVLTLALQGSRQTDLTKSVKSGKGKWRLELRFNVMSFKFFLLTVALILVP